MRLQEVRIHGNPPLNNKLSLTQSHLRRASDDALKLWINELSARGVRRFYLVSLLPRYGAEDLESILVRISRQVSLTTGALSAGNENLHARSK
jgi:hypothetical protein